jgi:CRISPR-associated protein Csh1
MIKEIVQFTESLPVETFSRNLQLKEGLYMFLDIQEENGEAVLKNVDEDGKLLNEDFCLYTEKTEMNPFLNACLNIQISSLPVSPAKIFNPNKKIYGASCSPFALAFIKKNFAKHDKSVLIKELSDQYFKKAEKYCVTDEQKEKFRLFRNFLIANIYELVTNLEEYNSAKDSYSVNIYLKGISKEVFTQVHELYLMENVFNKDDYNEKVNDEIFGISDSLSGFNDKKRFLKHQTSALKYNYRINGEEAQSLWKFFKLQQNKQLPNPCPVFVDENELNRGLVGLHQDGEVNSYSGMIMKLIQKYDKETLQNFYLIFFQGIKGSRIADIDFVPQFRFKLDTEVKMLEVFPLGGKFAKHQLKNIFQLQDMVFNRIFNNQLITKTKNGLWVKYFDDVEPNPKYDFTDAICNLMMQYRKAIYDYIYKAKYESITCKMFDQMMKTSILEDIRIDEDFNRGYAIKEKLNLWFSLYNFFNQNKNRENMASRIPELLEKMNQVANGENVSFSDDPAEFAFGAGQVVYFLLTKSASSNKTYAMLEPFLQKSKVSQLQESIGKTIAIYKHEIDISKGRFEKLASEVLVYNSDINMKDYLRYFLAGCFATSVIYEKRKIEENQEINN